MSFRWMLLSVLFGAVILFGQPKNCNRRKTLVPVTVEKYRKNALDKMLKYGSMISRLMAACRMHEILWLWELSLLANSAIDVMKCTETDDKLGIEPDRLTLFAKATETVEARILEYLKESGDDRIEYPFPLDEYYMIAHSVESDKIVKKVLVASKNLPVDGKAADYYKAGNLFMNHAGGDPDKIESIQAKDVAVDWGWTSRKLADSYRQAVAAFSNHWTCHESYRQLEDYRDSFVLAAKASIYGYVKVHVALFQSYIASFRKIKTRNISYLLTRRKSKINFKQSSIVWLCWIKPGHSLRAIKTALDLDYRDAGLLDLCAFFDSSIGDLTPDHVNRAAAYLDTLISAVGTESGNQIAENTQTLVDLTKNVHSTSLLKCKMITNDSKMLSFIHHLQNGIFRHVGFRQINLFFDCVNLYTIRTFLKTSKIINH